MLSAQAESKYITKYYDNSRGGWCYIVKVEDLDYLIATQSKAFSEWSSVNGWRYVVQHMWRKRQLSKTTSELYGKYQEFKKQCVTA